MIRVVVASLFFVGAVAGPVFAAAPLSTPLVVVNNGQHGVCMLTNVGTSDATLTDIQAYDTNGSMLLPTLGSTCTLGALSAGTSCTMTYPDNVDLRCSFTVSGKVRAAVQIYDSADGFVSGFPATKK